MSFNSFLKSIFGNKSDRDLKKLMPIVREIQKVYPFTSHCCCDRTHGRLFVFPFLLRKHTGAESDDCNG